MQKNAHTRKKVQQMMNKKDAENIIKDLSEKPFLCSEHCIETESGYVITTKEKRKYVRSKKQTNADRIRNMTDEELAEFLVTVNCAYCKHENTEKDCEDCFLEWLQAEAKEGTENG